MIFKTFDNDIDKWTAKIGIFGKSFNELGNAVRDAFKTTIDNIDNFDEDVSFWDALKNNLMPKNENGESWLKNSLGEIISKENIDSYIAELDLDSAKNKILDIFDWEDAIKNGDKTWQDYFDTLKNGEEKYIPDLIKNTDDLSKLTGEDLVRANQAARDAAIAHNAELKQQTLSAKAGQVALKGLAIAGNMLAMWAISEAIQLVSKGIKGLNDDCEQLENKISKLESTYDEQTRSIDEINSKLEENEQKINDILKLENPTYVDLQDLENLRTQNALLKENLALKEKSKEATNQEILDSLDEELEKEFFTNDAKLENATKLDSIDDYAKNIFTLGGYNLYQTQKYGGIFSGIEYEKTEYEKIQKTINALTELNKLKEEAYNNNGTAITKKTIAGKTYDIPLTLQEIEQKIQSYDEELQSYSTRILALLDKRMVYDPNNKSSNSKFLLSINDQIAKLLDFDTFASATVDKAIADDRFNKIGEKIKNSINNGIIKNEKDLLSDEEAKNLIRYISATLYDGATNDESLIKAASYIIKNFNNELKVADDKTDKSFFLRVFDSSDFAETKEKILDLAKSGEITPEVLESTEEYKTLLDKTGLSAEEAKNKILGLLNSQEKLAAASQGISKLKSAYEEFKDENIGFVTAETLESLPDVFKNLEGFDLFSKIVGDPTQGVEKIQKAFDDIVTEYIRTQGTLTGLVNASESEVNSYIANLKQMGITNAEEVVKSVKNSLSENDTLLQAAESEYIDYLKNKDKYDEDYLSNVASKNGQLISALGSGYQSDYDNWCNLLSKKSEAYNKFVSALGKSANNIMSSLYTDGDDSAYRNAKKIVESANSYGTVDKLAGIGFKNINAQYTNKQVMRAKQYIEDYESAAKMAEQLNFDLQTIDLDFGSPLSFDGSGSSSSSSSSDSTPSEQDFDWIERKVNNITKALNDLKDASDDTYSSWANRSTALTKAIDTTRQAIELQKQAYNRYMQEAESVGLPDIYKNLIKNGALDISTITDDSLKDKISDYQEWYDKAQDCLDVQKDLMDSLNELNSKKFDNIQSIFDFDKSNIEHSLTMLNNQIDKLEMKGLFANESYYNQMLQYTQKEINSLTNERKQLANVMNSSALSQDSEAWREMYSTLTQIDEEILELNNDLIEFNNSIRDLNWEVFEYLEESINRITDETDYLIDLLSNEDLYDKDNGNLTKYADATLGLYATAYDTYKQQAKDYYEEVQDLQRQLVNGAGKDVLEQYYKMVDAHQEAVKSANQEKQAILDLIEDGYKAQLEAIQKIIDKKKEQMQHEKDLFDYQKSIEDKTKNISSLQKQYDIYKNDMSEEGISQAQKIKVQLEEAKADLKETEYEQYLQDTQNMLDTLASDYEEWMNNRLDNEDALLSEIIGTVSGKGDEINSTLNEVADKYGTMISDSITSIFDAKSPFTNMLSNGINTINNSIAGTTSAIDRLIAKVANITNANTSKTNAGNGTKGSNPNPIGNSNNGNNTNISSNVGNNNSNNSTPQNSSNNSVWGSWFIRKTDSYPKDKLDIQNSIVDRLKYNSIDSSFTARSKYYSAMGGSGTYTGSASQNTWMLNQLKSHGYAKGSKRIPYDQIALLGEEGNELQFDISEGVLREVGEGDKIFTNEASKVLWDFSKNPSEFIEKFGLTNLTPQFNFVTPTLPPIARNNASNSVNMNVDGIEIILPSITNYKEFRNELIKDSNFTNAMGTYVNNKIMGKNSLEHLKYAK